MDNNKIITVQEMLMREMKRLDDDKYMCENGTEEIARSNALTNQATTYIKAINTQLHIMEAANKSNMTNKALVTKLGIEE